MRKIHKLIVAVLIACMMLPTNYYEIEPVKANECEIQKLGVVEDSQTVEEEIEVPGTAVDTATSSAIEAWIMEDETDIKMEVGDIYQVSPRVMPQSIDAPITYSVSGAAIVTVTEDGVIQALEPGTAFVLARLENGCKLVYEVTITDQAVPEKIRLINTGDKISLALRQTRRIETKCLPETAKEASLLWESDNAKIASVDSSGRITGNKTGTTKVRVYSKANHSISTTVKIVVTKRKKGTTYSEEGLSIVSTNHQKYTYKEMTEDIRLLSSKYQGILSAKVVGNSWDNRNLYLLTLGNPKAKKKVFVQASMHAREYMTAQLVMKQVEFYCANYYSGTYGGKYYSELFEDVCFQIVPMSNPDGVTISQSGANGIRNAALRQQVRTICKKYGRGRQIYYTRWKANARGVDLNRNFNGYWSKLSTTVHTPSGSGFKGKSPASEKESKLLVDLVNKGGYMAEINYHAMGRILYWNFGQKGADRTKELKLLGTVRAVCGYAPVYSKFSKSSAAGMADWVSIRKKLPTVTIEIGNVVCPLPQSQFSSVWRQNRQMLAAVANLYD